MRRPGGCCCRNAESLGILGIDVSLRVLDSAMAINFLRQRRYDAYLRGHEFLNPPLGELESYFASATADLPVGGNLSAIRDPVVGALIELAENREYLVGSSVRIRDSWWVR